MPGEERMNESQVGEVGEVDRLLYEKEKPS